MATRYYCDRCEKEGDADNEFKGIHGIDDKYNGKPLIELGIYAHSLYGPKIICSSELCKDCYTAHIEWLKNA